MLIDSGLHADRDAGGGCHGDEPRRVSGAPARRRLGVVLPASPVDLRPETSAGLRDADSARTETQSKTFDGAENESENDVLFLLLWRQNNIFSFFPKSFSM